MVTTIARQVRPVKVTFIEEVSTGHYVFGFSRDFGFTAGQVVGISPEKQGPRRLYSICSGENDPQVQILFNVIKEGYLSPLLAELKPGDTVWITEPRGEFTGRPGPAVWIATGTGIAPFYSMFRSGLAEGKILIHGNRYLEQFHFYDEFSSLMGTNYIRCCTAEWDERVYPGRVTGFLAERTVLDPAVNYYLCGSAEMVVDTRDLLIGRGIPYNRILSEIYF